MLNSIIRNVTLLIIFALIATTALEQLQLPKPGTDPPSEAAVRQGTIAEVTGTDQGRQADRGAERDSHQRDYYGGQTLALDAGPGGHFFVEAAINYDRIRFLVDTGASMVALTRADAERLGFDLYNLDYRYHANTANGVARVARVVLDEIVVGDIVVENVPAAVVDGDLEISLLGMSFLNRLSGFEVRDDQLILRW